MLSCIDIGEKLRSKKIDFKGECCVFEFCNPQSAAEVLHESRDVASLLPCRIAITKEPGENDTTLSSVVSTALVSLVGSPFVVEASEEEIEMEVRAIIADLASGPRA